ncbi:hypothetical protein [Streptomyces sp. NPDC048057]|uniref:hypothetical protein n=1 Tax=Streptomyces sp. NPDC048057 TaxID=3155628 RepID=UPI00340D7678
MSTKPEGQRRGRARHRREKGEGIGRPIAFLAAVSLAAPAWILRGEAADLLGAGVTAPISAPDAGSDPG